MRSLAIDDYLSITATTHGYGGGLVVPTSIAYTVYKGATAISGALTAVAMTAVSGKTGIYRDRLQLTAAAGFEAGVDYDVLIEAVIETKNVAAWLSFQIGAKVDLRVDLSTADVMHDIATGVTEFLASDGQTAVRTATRYGDVTVDGANWTDATKTLTLAGAFANYVWRSGDTITLTAGTGVVAGQYTIASRVDDDSITLSTDINGASSDVSDASIDGVIITGRWLDRMS